jgi:hypothetical protein
MVQNLESTGAAEDTSSTIDKLSNLWCVFIHDAPSWPIDGHYTCKSLRATALGRVGEADRR